MPSPFTTLAGKKISAASPSNLILVEYDPSLSPRVPFGEKIVLVQSVIRILDGTSLMPSDFYGKGGSFDWKDKTCLTGAGKAGYGIDGLKTEMHPYYNDPHNTESASEKARPGWTVGKATFAGLPGRSMSVAVDDKGRHNTLRYERSYVTRLTDGPRNGGGKNGFYHKTSNPGGWKTCVLDFQVFAFCSKGLDCGEWYEGVAWRYTKTHKDQEKGTPGVATYVGALDKPDADFIAAFELFNKERKDADGFVKLEHVPCR